MSCNWLRRAALVAACASAFLLVACGSGSTESQLKPVRIVSFGDGFSDLGQTGSRYTVNDGSVNIWTHEVATGFGLPLVTASAGGKSYAVGNARVNSKPDAAGNSATLTVKEQVDSFLASDTIGPTDLFLVGTGIGDIGAEMGRVSAGAQTSAQALVNVRQAGTDLGAQVRRLVGAGGKFIAVAGPYNLGRSPWAIAIGQTALLLELSSKFNEGFLVSVVDLGANVLYVDAALQFNLETGVPSVYSLTDVTSPACTSVDPGPGIGTGNGQVNSALCTTGTLLPGINYTTYLFADRIYPTPQGQRLFGDYAYSRIRSRW